MADLSLDDSVFEEHFLLSGRMEILSLLQDLVHRHEAISVAFDKGRESLLTQIIDVRGSGIVFDCSVDEKTNQRILSSERLVFRGRPGGVLVHFVTPTPQRVAWDGGVAFWVAFPTTIARMQRREIYRVTAPIAKPIVVTIETESRERFRLSLHDLSVAGFGVTIQDHPAFPAVGTALPLISVHLPDSHWLELKGTVRHFTSMQGPGKPKYRAGIALQAVDSRSDASLQRLVIRLDQDHHKLTRET